MCDVDGDFGWGAVLWCGVEGGESRGESVFYIGPNRTEPLRSAVTLDSSRSRWRSSSRSNARQGKTRQDLMIIDGCGGACSNRGEQR